METEAGGARILYADEGLSLDDIAALARIALEGSDQPPGGARVFKRNLRRLVFAADSPVGPIVVKRAFEERTVDRLRSLVRPPRGLAEARALADARRLGVEAPRPLLVVRPRGRSRSPAWALVLEHLPNEGALGPHLEARHRPGDRSAAKRDLVAAALGDLAALHAAGRVPLDLHGGNWLVLEGGARPRLAVIDLQRVRRGRASAALRARSLAVLLHSLRFALDERERAEAARLYARLAGLGDSERFARTVGRSVRRRERARIRSRRRRCRVESSGFRRLRRGGVEGFARRDAPDEVLFEAVRRAREARRLGSFDLLAISPRGFVARARVADRSWVVKTYEGDGRRGWRGRLGRGRAFRAYCAGWELEVRGVDAARVVAWLRTPDRAFLVTEEVPDAVPLHRMAFLLSEGSEKRRGFRVARAVARLLAQLIPSGLDVHDLSPKNVLVRGEGRDERAYLCDFDGIRRSLRLSRRATRRALGQVSDADPDLPEILEAFAFGWLDRRLGGRLDEDDCRAARAVRARRARRSLGSRNPRALPDGAADDR